MFDSVKILFGRWQNIIDLLSLSMGLGVNWTIISVVAILLQPFGYTQIQIGIVGLWFCVVGTIAGLAATLFLDWQIRQGVLPSYDFLIQIFMVMALAGMVKN